MLCLSSPCVCASSAVLRCFTIIFIFPSLFDDIAARIAAAVTAKRRQTALADPSRVSEKRSDAAAPFFVHPYLPFHPFCLSRDRKSPDVLDVANRSRPDWKLCSKANGLVTRLPVEIKAEPFSRQPPFRPRFVPRSFVSFLSFFFLGSTYNSPGLTRFRELTIWQFVSLRIIPTTFSDSVEFCICWREGRGGGGRKESWNEMKVPKWISRTRQKLFQITFPV